MKLVSVVEMQTIEKAASARGISYADMMQRAGQGVAEVVLREFGNLLPEGVIGLVGTGNNGGDTLVALTTLSKAGWRARAWLTQSRGAGDKLVEEFLKTGGEVISSHEDLELKQIDTWLEEGGVLLDGILGTGFRLPLKPEIKKVLAHIRDRSINIHVVAVDCPSGVDCDSGAISEETLTAEITVCMAAVKRGLLRFPAFEKAGELEVVSIGLPDDLAEWEGVRAEVIDAQRVKAVLPIRRRESHKGSYGIVLAVGGSVNYTGAIGLAARAAYAMGCGLLRVAIPSGLHPALAGSIPEATWLLLPQSMGVIASEAAEVVLRAMEGVDVLLIGPGMGEEEATSQFIRRLVGEKGTRKARGKMGFQNETSGVVNEVVSLPPVVLDADALRMLAHLENWNELIPQPAVLTPHPGEMAALTGLSISEIQADRVEVARRYAAQWGHVVTLKGAITVIAAPDGRLAMIPLATSALAKAGTGDVLAGMIASLRAQGVGAYEAALAAAWIHAEAGMVAEYRVGSPASVLASDVIRAIPEVLQQLG